MSDSSYDCWKTRAPEDDGPVPAPCPVCTGDEEAEACTEDCDRIMRRVRLERGIKGLYGAAFTAVGMAKVYRREAGPTDRRMVKALAAVGVYRASIRALREDLSKVRAA